jgi:hypothetical protein
VEGPSTFGIPANEALQPFLQAEQQYNSMLSGKSWPLIPVGDVEALVNGDRLDAAALSALASSEPRPSEKTVAALVQARETKAAVIRRIDAELGLPE